MPRVFENNKGKRQMVEQPEFFLQIESEIEQYRHVWPTAAADQLDTRCGKAQKLRKLAMPLLLHWRAYAYGAGMPEQFVLAGKAAVEGFQKSGGVTEVLDIAPKIVNGLAIAVPEMVNEEGLARRLEQAAILLGANFQEQRNKDIEVYPVDVAWHEHLQSPVFQLYIWSSMRLCYQGVYNAYEDFVIQVIRAILEIPPQEGFRANDPRFKEVFTKDLGPPLWDECWKGKEIRDIKLIRHSLTHASGRMTPNMKEAGIKIEMVNGVIQILPHRIRELYQLLAPRAMKIIVKAAEMSCFS
jgi:hypothetical protein